MTAQRFRIIDADGHVMEPVGMWERYIDPAFRARAPRLVKEGDGHTRFTTEGRMLPRSEHRSAAHSLRHGSGDPRRPRHAAHPVTGRSRMR